MERSEHDYRIQPQPLRPLDLPAKSLIGLAITALTALVLATTADAFSVVGSPAPCDVAPASRSTIIITSTIGSRASCKRIPPSRLPPAGHP